jgi:hypothetical protein
MSVQKTFKGGETAALKRMEKYMLNKQKVA